MGKLILLIAKYSFKAGVLVGMMIGFGIALITMVILELVK